MPIFDINKRQHVWQRMEQRRERISCRDDPEVQGRQIFNYDIQQKH